MHEIVNIVIPIYKPIPDEMESISFGQVLKVLQRYVFRIVSPIGLDLSFYERLLKKSNINYTVESFDRNYFQSIEGYNRLLLSEEFYCRFTAVKYILIYQLDAYVFKDELEYWCAAGYDYIGAPWLENYARQVPEGADPVKYVKVGNGGLSLRKVDAALKRLRYRLPVESPRAIWSHFSGHTVVQKLLRIPLVCCKILGYKNTMKYYSTLYSHNEDVFWCVFLGTTRLALRIPDVEMAAGFSLEVGAEKLFREGHFSLPFGCHAWNKYDKDFWMQFVADKT